MTRPPIPRRFTAILLLFGLLMLGAAITAAGLPTVTSETNNVTADPGGDEEMTPVPINTPTPDDGGSSSDGGTIAEIRVQADFPARTVEAGETAVFVLNIENRGAEEKVRRLRATLPPGVAGWEYRFTDDERHEENLEKFENIFRELQQSRQRR